MRILFAHQNFPGQYAHLLRHYASDPANEIVFLICNVNARFPGIRKIVARVALRLKKEGFVPDVMIGHNAWGETLYLKDVFPDASLLSYFECYMETSHMPTKRVAITVGLFLVGMGITVGLVFTKQFYAFLVYVALALGVTTALVRLSSPGWARWAIAAFSLVSFWLMGHIDEYFGAIEHRKFCERDAGVLVYKKAKLPKEFYNADGTPNFLQRGDPDERRLKKYVQFKHENAVTASDRYVLIEKRVFQIIDISSSDVLAQKIDFVAWPSPFIPTVMQIGAKGCYEDIHKEANMYLGMYQQVFDK